MTTKPDVDLTDGNFYADGRAREHYRWMRANEPVFRDRNGLAAAASYQAVIDAERNPELFSNAGGIRPDQPGVEMMIEMDDPQHLLRRKLVNSGFTRKRVKDLESSIGSLCDTLIDGTWPRRYRWRSSATCSGCVPRNARCSSSGPTTWSAR
jgi:cholest-4-en-3-one 26-monooxygenase